MDEYLKPKLQTPLISLFSFLCVLCNLCVLCGKHIHARYNKKMEKQPAKQMQIAIVGAGFCGLATAWYLYQKYPNIHITLFDAKPIGKATSALAGLLHCYSGAHAKRAPFANEALNESLNLLTIASQTVNQTIFKRTGLFRPATTAAQHSDFLLTANMYANDVHWINDSEIRKKTENLIHLSGIFIDDAFVVDCELYLNALWLACLKKGACFKQSYIRSISTLDAFDRIIFTLGAETLSIPELSHLPIKQVKGQILEFSWPNKFSPLPFPINAHVYLFMHPQNGNCIAGATYERDFTDTMPDKTKALAEILPKAQLFFPHLSTKECIDCRAGLRASTPDHKPLLKKLSERCWILTGMGSKGLLYHALYAKKLAEMIEVT